VNPGATKASLSKLPKVSKDFDRVQLRLIIMSNMNTSQIFIAVSIAVLAFIALLVFFIGKSRKENRLTPLAGLAFGFVIAGIIFGDDRLISYSLYGIAVILSVIDMIKKLRKK